MLWLALLITGLLIGLALIASLNALTFPRLRPAARPPAALSILIPARDEAAVIGATIRAWLAEAGPQDEVLVLDDHSSDGTGALARAAAAGDPRLRVLAGRPLPSGWLGKNWACHQLAEAARHDALLFTDADVRWRPGGLAALAAEFQRSRADLLTVWPTQETVTWGERLVVPLLALAVGAYLPVLATHYFPAPACAAAIGQCLLFRRAAYTRVGGHAGVRGEIVEDVSLARRIKAAGLRLRAADGAGLLVCRMYRGWAEVRAGFAKNILAGHGRRPALLGLSTLFHWAVFVSPWLWLGAALAGAGDWRWPLAAAALGLLTRALTAAATRQRVGDAVLLPVSVGLMTVIAGQALLWHRRGGPRWKGRTLGAGRDPAASL